MKVAFKGPSLLDLTSVALKVSPPDFGGEYVPQIGPVTRVEGTTNQYTFQWQGPWTYAMDTAGTISQVRLPHGNYTIEVRGRKGAASPEIVSAPYSKVSLVRVSEIQILPDEWISQNPAVDLHPDEAALPPTSTGQRRPRPASGKRIYAESDWDAATNSIGPVHDTVRLQITTEPKIDTEDVSICE